MDELDTTGIIYTIRDYENPNGHGFYQLDEIETNFILSVYGKEDFELYFEERITPERLVYFNKEKGRELERLAGIQFPGNYFSFDPNTIIRYPHCIDKNKVPVQEPKIISNCELSSKAVEASKAANALKNRTANQCNHIEQNR